MAYTTVFEEVVFVEGNNEKAERKVNIDVNLGGIGAQLKSLKDVKSSLAMQAKQNGCNCVLDFKYGQKTALFAFDDVKFYGNGVASQLPGPEYAKIIENKSK